MLSTVESLLLCAATTESVLGFLGNGFIALVNCIEYGRRKKFSKIGFILTGLAISRICLIWLLIFDAYKKMFFPHMLTFTNLDEYINYLWTIISHLNVWFAANLSVFYFLKIANFSHHIFLWLKRRMNAVFVFLIGCLLVSLLTSFPFIVKVIRHDKIQYRNTSRQFPINKSKVIFDYMSVNIGIFFFFTIALITCLLLLISLWKHNRQMQSAVSGFRDLNREIHVKAMKVLIYFIIFFGLHFIGIAIEILCLFIPENKVLFMFGLIAACMYPCCHSFILILANHQLKQASLEIMQYLKYCEKGPKGPWQRYRWPGIIH